MYFSRASSFPNTSGSMCSPLFSTLSRARSCSWSSVHPALATPTTGMFRLPRRTIAYRAGKICLCARSPVAPKKTSASDCSAAMGSPRLLLEVAPEAEPHGRLDLLREVGLASRREAAVERRAQHWCWHRLVDRGHDRPASLAGVRHAAGELAQLRTLRERSRAQVEQPRRDHAAAPPHLGDLARVAIVLVVLGMPQRSRLGVDVAMLLAGVRVVQDVEPLGVRGHEAVLDAVVHHLHEVPGAVRTAVQVPLIGRALARPPWRGRSGVAARSERR